MFRIKFPTKRIFRIFPILRMFEWRRFGTSLWNDPRNIASMRVFLIIRPILLYKRNNILTAHEDLQFAKVYVTDDGKLQNKVSVSPHVALALQVNRIARWNGARILATHGVVPQCWCGDFG